MDFLTEKKMRAFKWHIKEKNTNLTEWFQCDFFDDLRHSVLSKSNFMSVFFKKQFHEMQKKTFQYDIVKKKYEICNDMLRMRIQMFGVNILRSLPFIFIPSEWTFLSDSHLNIKN